MAENFVIFEVAGASYAVRAEQVQMIEMVEHITRVPNAPQYVEGVMAVRGKVIPVVSVRRKFNMEIIPVDLRARVIVVHLQNRLVGMLVDTAREFSRFSVEQVMGTEGLSGPGVDYLDGVISNPDRLILIVNLDLLLSLEEREGLNVPFDVQVEKRELQEPEN
jgi:purine-binding chemotaxis protein CheW